MRSTFVALIVAPCAVALAIVACTSSDNPSPANGTTNDASTADATRPVVDSSTPGDDASASDAHPDGDDDQDANADAGEDAALTCSTWDAAREYDASEGDGGTSINADGGAVLPGPPSPFGCSLTGDTHAPIHVVNNAPCPIEFWWVDYNCQEQLFGSADPNGGTFDNDTFETHPWRIRLQGSEELLEEIPPVPEGTIDGGTNLVYP